MDRIFDTNEIAQSLYRLFAATAARAAGTPGEIPTWESLGYEHQHPWLVIAAKGPNRLERLEGTPLRDVAFHIWNLAWFPDDPDARAYFDAVLPWNARIQWEAVTRHLFTLMDCEDLGSPEESEAMYVEWFAGQLNRQPALVGG